jgi:hypothetical protein
MSISPLANTTNLRSPFSAPKHEIPINNDPITAKNVQPTNRLAGRLELIIERRAEDSCMTNMTITTVSQSE